MTLRTCGDSGGRTKSGANCRTSLNLGASGLCLQHDPARAAERQAVHAAGGKATAARKRERRAAAGPRDIPAAPKSLDDAVRISAWITHATLQGEIDVRVSEAATKAIRQFQLCVEKRELVQRLKEAQAELDALKKAKGRFAGARAELA